jgi:hypothetical protein
LYWGTPENTVSVRVESILRVPGKRRQLRIPKVY